jgi:hypothetical protein
MKDILNVLQKGALLAQNPGQFESIKELDEKDLEVIRREKTREFPIFLSELYYLNHLLKINGVSPGICI